MDAVFLLLVLELILCTVIEAPMVIGGSITVVQGGNADLSCKLTDTTEALIQISWQKITRAKPQNENFFTILASNGPEFVNGYDVRFKFIGNIKDNDGSLQLINATLMDEGTYTCIFTLFPSGNHMTEIHLNLLVPPVTSLEDKRPALGDKEVPLVTCTAAGSRPPAEVKWLTGTLTDVRVETNSTNHANGTTTTVSWLFGVPTREIYRHPVQCVVSHAALLKEETLPFDIQIYFPPMEVNIRQLPNSSFECVTEANPNADVTWSRVDKEWPQVDIEKEAPTLRFPSTTYDLNGLYQCEASNAYGTKRGHLYVHVASGACSVCWTLFSLLIILNVAAVAAAWYYYKFKRQKKEEGTNEERQAVAATSTTQGVGRVEEKEEKEEEEEGSL